MTDEPTTAPDGETDMPKIAKARTSPARSASPRNLHPGMMGDGTEEQNLGQTGNPSARVTQGDVEAAFGKRNGRARALKAEIAEDVEDMVEDAGDRISALADKVSAMRDQVAQSAEAARVWALRQADAAKQTASEKPVLVVSVSAGVALALGLMAGFVIGRATADDY